MRNLGDIFGKSPFEAMVEHARKVHECVAMVRPIADAILAADMARLNELQDRITTTEHEADLIKDSIRQHLPGRFFLPVDRDDLDNFLRQMDRMADETQDFGVIATFRKLQLPAALHGEFLALVDKVVQVSETLVRLAEHLAELQRDGFSGSDADEVLEKVKDVAHMEWETDQLSRTLARHYYSMDGLDPVTIMILDKLCRSLGGIANHAENVGKNLRLMILRK